MTARLVLSLPVAASPARPADYRLRLPSDPADLPDLFGHCGAAVVDARDLDGFEPRERVEEGPR